jgi:predicted RNase H-like nuclease (RuvC/YqgF family)
MSQQQRGADPTKVIQKMGSQIGSLYTEIAARDAIIEDLENELSALKAQQTDKS